MKQTKSNISSGCNRTILVTITKHHVTTNKPQKSNSSPQQLQPLPSRILENTFTNGNDRHIRTHRVAEQIPTMKTAIVEEILLADGLTLIERTGGSLVDRMQRFHVDDEMMINMSHMEQFVINTVTPDDYFAHLSEVGVTRKHEDVLKWEKRNESTAEQ